MISADAFAKLIVSQFASSRSIEVGDVYLDHAIGCPSVGVALEHLGLMKKDHCFLADDFIRLRDFIRQHAGIDGEHWLKQLTPQDQTVLRNRLKDVTFLTTRRILRELVTMEGKPRKPATKCMNPII